MANEKLETILSIYLSTITGGAAILSSPKLDMVEQVGRIILLGISILSGLMLILVNWEKASKQLKKLFKNGINP